MRTVATASQVLGAVQAVVEANATHNTFYSVWAPSKEKPSEPAYPCVFWRDWNAQMPEDGEGMLHRVQLVRLLIVTSTETDRTAAEREAAVNAADQAAVEIVTALRATYRDSLEIGNVLITTRWDEGPALETGVFLTFTVRSIAGECEDGTPGELPAPISTSAFDTTTNPGYLTLPDGGLIPILYP